MKRVTGVIYHNLSAKNPASGPSLEDWQGGLQ